MRFLRAALVLSSFFIVAGCNNSSSSTTPTQNFVTDVLTGTVQPPVNGALQSSYNTFVVGQGGGTVSVVLTSAVETLPGGTLLPTVSMGVSIGTLANSVCTPQSNASTIAQASSAIILQGSLGVGTFCVLVADVTNQTGPVAYAVAVSHP